VTDGVGIFFSRFKREPCVFREQAESNADSGLSRHPLPSLLCSRHLQREMENQAAQVERYQQKKQEVEQDVRKNEDLLRRAHAELKKTQVGKQTL